MNDMLIIGILLLFIVSLLALDFEKRLKSNPYLLMISIFITIGYGGYLTGDCDEKTISRVILIVLFYGSGIWRMWQFHRLKQAK